MNLRLSRELVSLVRYICAKDYDEFLYNELLQTEVGGDCYPLCLYLIEKRFVHDGGYYVGVSKAVREAMLRHALDLVDFFEKAEHDRNLSNQEKIDNISYGKKAYDLAADTAKWNKRSILFTGIVALGQLIQWIILIIQELSTP